MIIGFAGRKRSGKDTAAAVLEPKGFARLSFAQPIKSMLGVFLGNQGLDPHTVVSMLEGDLKEEPSPYLQGQSPRYAMQTLGTEWGRNLLGGEIWVRALINRAHLYENVVISDVRFPNEVAAVQYAGGKVYRISRPGLSVVDDHASENQIDHLLVDGQILNDGSLEDFYSKVQGVITIGDYPHPAA